MNKDDKNNRQKDEWEELEENDFDRESHHSERVKILVAVIPFVLIIIILAVTLIVSSVKNKKSSSQGGEDLQQSIMDYADGGSHDDNEDIKEAVAASTPESLQEDAAATPMAETAPDVQPSPTPYKEVMEKGKVDYSKVTFNKDEQLKEMMSYWADNNQQALDDLAKLDRFIAMSFKLKGTKDFYYYGAADGSGKPSGTGIAVYADNQYYYGEWKNGVRSGNGTWMHYHIHPTENKKDLYTYHQYTGSWENDLPEGEGSEHYDYVIELLKENVGYNTNLIGSYKAGLVDGEFYITNIYSDKNTKEWYASAENGSWNYQNGNKDKNGRRPVQVEDRDPENFIWMYPKENANIGVPCLISQNKN